MKILDELWRGNLDPSAKQPRGKEFAELEQYNKRHWEKLSSQLSPEAMKTLEKWRDNTYEMWEFSQADAFRQGFSLGMSMTVEAMLEIKSHLYENGDRKQKWIPTGLLERGNKRRAEQLLNKELAKLENGEDLHKTAPV